jgi:predicted Fe-Mo cluster-binding NifX family protein
MTKSRISNTLMLLILIGNCLFFSGCEGEVSYRPPYLPVKLAVDDKGNISIQGQASLVTAIGEFSISVKAAPVVPENSLLVIVRDRKRGIDRMYKIDTGSGEFTCVINGSVTLRITNKQVLVDISNGDVKSIEIEKRNKAQEIYDAAKAGDATMVSVLLNSDSSLISTKDRDGETLLHLVAANSHRVDVAEMLIANGADVNKQCLHGWTPLHNAALSGDEAIVKLLIAHKANINVQNNLGDTPLHCALQKGQKNAARILINSGADTTIKNNKGEAALQYLLDASK